MDNKSSTKKGSNIAILKSRRRQVMYEELHIWPLNADLLCGFSRDVAQAHVLAMEGKSAGGERFIVSNGPFCIQDICT